MSLNGRESYHALLHDLIESMVHLYDKKILEQSKEVINLRVRVDRSLDFKNDFPDELSKKGTYLAAPERLEQVAKWMPEEWEKSGNLAYYSLASEVGALERAKSDIKNITLPIGAPSPLPVLRETTGEEHFKLLLENLF